MNTNTQELSKKEEQRLYYKLWSSQPEVKIQLKEYARARSHKYQERRKAYNERNAEHRKQYHLKRYEEQKELIKERERIRYRQNKASIRAKQTVYNRKKYKEDPAYKLSLNLRTRILAAIKRGKSIKHSKTVDLIGCTISEARHHIESLWQPGMNWSNHNIHGWHIDHIRPCCTFDLTDPEQQKQCFHYTNLRPLWARDNLARPSDGSDIKQPETATLEK
jgi:hypothetical protein